MFKFKVSYMQQDPLSADKQPYNKKYILQIKMMYIYFENLIIVTLREWL